MLGSWIEIYCPAEETISLGDKVQIGNETVVVDHIQTGSSPRDKRIGFYFSDPSILSIGQLVRGPTRTWALTPQDCAGFVPPNFDPWYRDTPTADGGWVMEYVGGPPKQTEAYSKDKQSLTRPPRRW